MDEPALKARLGEMLADDFRLEAEVEGKSIVDGAPLRADFLIFPLPHLVAHGFTAEWLGVEVKSVDFQTCSSKKLYGTFWQAVCYAQTKFAVGGITLRPAGCALFVGDFPRRSTCPVTAAQLRRWEILLELGVYTNTGIFRGTSKADWALFFGQGRYFSKRDGLSKVPRGFKRYTGNIYKRPKAARSDDRPRRENSQ